MQVSADDGLNLACAEEGVEGGWIPNICGRQ